MAIKHCVYTLLSCWQGMFYVINGLQNSCIGAMIRCLLHPSTLGAPRDAKIDETSDQTQKAELAKPLRTGEHPEFMDEAFQSGKGVILVLENS